MNYLSISEAAKYLGVSVSSLRRWERAGKMSSVRTPGGARRYELAYLERYLKDVSWQEDNNNSERAKDVCPIVGSVEARDESISLEAGQGETPESNQLTPDGNDREVR